MKDLHSFETTKISHPTTHCHVLEDLNVTWMYISVLSSSQWWLTWCCMYSVVSTIVLEEPVPSVFAVKKKVEATYFSQKLVLPTTLCGITFKSWFAKQLWYQGRHTWVVTEVLALSVCKNLCIHWFLNYTKRCESFVKMRLLWFKREESILTPEMCVWCPLLGVFTKLQKVTVSCHVCPCFHPHGATHLPLCGFSLNLILEFFSKIWLQVSWRSGDRASW